MYVYALVHSADQKRRTLKLTVDHVTKVKQVKFEISNNIVNSPSSQWIHLFGVLIVNYLIILLEFISFCDRGS